MIVQKYGGMTLADPEKIKAVAARLAEASKKGQKVVAVVSAMGKTTNQLIELANKVSGKPNRREMDMLLTTGERVSMALLSMALHDLGCPAISLTGSQAGILTTSSHVNADIVDVKAFRVQEALKMGKVVVLAGFQGVCPETKEITTLGRGGSDTTAVAMAAFLGADRCEILKDVPAIFTADPQIIPEAKAISHLNYQQLVDMTFWGAKVLHVKSVLMAKDKGVKIFVGPAALTSTQTSEGSLVQDMPPNSFKAGELLAINSYDKVLEIENIEMQELEKYCNERDLTTPMLLYRKESNVLVSAPDEVITTFETALQKDKSHVSHHFSSVTATAKVHMTPELEATLTKRMQAQKIQIFQAIKHDLSMTYLVSPTERKSAIKVLHSVI
jgi:aspartate kinase